MKKSFFQKSPLWLLLPITIISLVFAGCSSDSSDSDSGSSSSISGLSYVTVASRANANVDISFSAPPEADAVKIVATPTSEGLNSPLDSILGSVLSSFEEAKTVTVTVPRSQFSSSSGAISKITLKGLRSYTSYSFNVYAVSESGESSAVSDLPEVAIPVVTTAPQDVISQSDVSILLEEDKSIKLKWDTNRIQAGLVDFIKVRFSVHTTDNTEIAVYNVDDLSAGEVTLSDINTIDPAAYTVKAQYTSANGVVSTKKMVINLVPSKLKSDIQAIAGLKVEAKNKANSADADEALYISWTNYDYSAAKAGTKIAVTVSVGKFPIKTIMVNNASVTDINKAVPVTAGHTVFFPTKNAIWVSNLYGTKNYTVSAVVHDDYGSMSEAMTASAKTTDTQTEPVTGVIGRPLGNSIIAAWRVPDIGDYVGVNVRLLNTDDSVKPTQDDPDKNVVNTLEIRGDTILRAVFNDVKAGTYRVAVATVDASGNVSKQGDKDLFVESTADATIAADAKKDTTAPSAPTLDPNYPKYYYKANGTEVDVVLQLAFDPASNLALQDVKNATVILSKKEGKDDAAATAVKTASVVSTSTYEPQTGFFMTLRNLKRDTASLVTKYTATIYYTDVFGNGDGKTTANNLSVPLNFDKVSAAPQKSEVAFTNTPKGNGLYGIEIASSVSGYDDGVPLIKATVTFSSRKRLLALYGSDETVPIVAKQLDSTGSVYFGEKDGISFPEGTENAGKTAIESGGMTYKAKLFEVYGSGLYSQATALDDITVADIVSTAPEAAAIEGVTGDSSTSTLIFNETTGELTVPFKESGGTAAKGPANNTVAANKVLYKVYATTETVSGSTADDKIKNIKDIANIRMAQVQGTTSGADRTVKFFGFSADDKDATFTVAIEAINTFNTSFSSNVTATGKAQQKTATALGSGATFSYAGNGNPKVANTYTFAYSGTSKTETIAKPTLTSLTVPSGATLSKFTLTYVSGVNFKLASDPSADAVTIANALATVSSGQLSNNAGAITVNSNVDVAGTGKYRVSLTATGSAAPYVVLTKEVSITIQKNSLSGVTHVLSPTFVGNAIQVGDTEVSAVVTMKNLPDVPTNYTTQVLQGDTLLFGTSIIEVVGSVTGSGASRKEIFTITAQPKAADKGPYTLILTPNTALSKLVSGSYEIDFDVKSTVQGIKYSDTSYTWYRGISVGNSITVTKVPNDLASGGTYAISATGVADAAAFKTATGLTFSTSTGQITGAPNKIVAAKDYTITYTVSSTDYTTVLNIEIANSISYPASNVVIQGATTTTSNTTIVATKANGLASGTYRRKSGTTLPTGLQLEASSGKIYGKVTTAQVVDNYTIEYINSSNAVLTEVDVNIQVNGINYANTSYTWYTGIGVGDSITPTKIPDDLASGGTYAISASGVADAAAFKTTTGLTFSTSTGAITGTPTKVVSAKNYTITYTVSSVTYTVVLNIGINNSISYPASNILIQGATATTTSNTTIIATERSGLASDGTYRVKSGNTLPAGLQLEASSGKIYGSATVAKAVTSYTLEYITSGASPTVITEVNVSIQVNGINYSAAAYYLKAGVNSTVDITAPTLVGVSSGVFSVPSSGTGSLPAGLSLNTSGNANTHGKITGTPSTAANSPTTVTVSYTTGGGTANEKVYKTSINISVYAFSYTSPSAYLQGTAITSLTPTTTGLPTGTYAISASGVADAAAFKAATGLDFSTSTGVISGRPTKAIASAAYSVTYTLAGANSTLATASVTLAVNGINYAGNSTFSYVKDGSNATIASPTKVPSGLGSGTYSVQGTALPNWAVLSSVNGSIAVDPPSTAQSQASYVIVFTVGSGSNQKVYKTTIKLTVTDS